ncbi:MAG: hypothetical protein C4541_08800 [Candidatus Auribacter fodinae]|uniref:Uncharacterized protein n=1 Tax=Candidatus Auribacter fodinae TaxID=2093366 RepID=A0A3A4R5N4_9BACT|nr:MAG: hypothetical protein C4541_08800 [Candidatus Auribacter fodinae]
MPRTVSRRVLRPTLRGRYCSPTLLPRRINNDGDGHAGTAHSGNNRLNLRIGQIHINNNLIIGTVGRLYSGFIRSNYRNGSLIMDISKLNIGGGAGSSIANQEYFVHFLPGFYRTFRPELK